MKTAEEWLQIQVPHLAKQRQKYGDFVNQVWIDNIKQIQLDAMKKGMCRAAEVYTQQMRVEFPKYIANRELVITDAILIAANQLTEKDI